MYYLVDRLKSAFYYSKALFCRKRHKRPWRNVVTKIYNNPPVVEAWIEFHFEYGEEAPKWDENIAVQFVNSLGKQFNQEEHGLLFKKGFKKFGISDKMVELSDPVFERIKTFNSTKDRCVQVEQNLLVYNMLRKEPKWPGFSVLIEEVLPILQHYFEDFHPVKIKKAVLNYRDHVMVPFKKGKLEPKDYFNIYPNTPKEIGDMAHFSLSMTLPKACQDAVVQFSVKTIPSINEGEQLKLSFMIDWNIRSTVSFDCSNKNLCKEWLNSAHKGISKAFEECLTEKCRGLFS